MAGGPGCPGVGDQPGAQPAERVPGHAACATARCAAALPPGLRPCTGAAPPRLASPSTCPALLPPAAPRPSHQQISGDPRGFDLTGDGERWEAAGGDEISEANEFPTVRRTTPCCCPRRPCLALPRVVLPRHGARRAALPLRGAQHPSCTALPWFSQAALRWRIHATAPPTASPAAPCCAVTQVLYDRWVEVLTAAADALEWEPAQVCRGVPVRGLRCGAGPPRSSCALRRAQQLTPAPPRPAHPQRSGTRCGRTFRSGGAGCSAPASTLAATLAWLSCRTSVRGPPARPPCAARCPCPCPRRRRRPGLCLLQALPRSPPPAPRALLTHLCPPHPPPPLLAVETYASGAPKQRKRKAPVEEAPAEAADAPAPGAKKAKDAEEEAEEEEEEDA